MAVIPAVTIRPKPPAGQLGSVELKSSKKEDKKQVIQVHDPEPDTEHTEDGGLFPLVYSHTVVTSFIT